MLRAAIFDIDGTLIDSVDLHALAWRDALAEFGHSVSFEDIRGQIGKGGDQLVPVYLSEAEQADHGDAMQAWRGEHFTARYLPMVRPFSGVPDLLRRVREAGLKVAIASSAKSQELKKYFDIAGIADLVDVATSSDDAEDSKPSPDIFQAALKKLGVTAKDAMAVGDTPYDAAAAGRAGMECVGVLCGGFTEAKLRQAGCTMVYPGPAAIFASFGDSPFAAAD